MCRGLKKAFKTCDQIDAKVAISIASSFPQHVTQVHIKGRLESWHEMWFALICGSSPLLWWLTHTHLIHAASSRVWNTTPGCSWRLFHSQCHKQVAVFARGDNNLGSYHFVMPRICHFHVLDCGTGQVRRVLDMVSQAFLRCLLIESMHPTSENIRVLL